MDKQDFSTPGSLGNGLVRIHPAVAYEARRKIRRLLIILCPIRQSLGQLLQLCPVLFQLLHLNKHLAPEPEVTNNIPGHDVTGLFVASANTHL